MRRPWQPLAALFAALLATTHAHYMVNRTEALSTFLPLLPRALPRVLHECASPLLIHLIHMPTTDYHYAAFVDMCKHYDTASRCVQSRGDDLEIITFKKLSSGVRYACVDERTTFHFFTPCFVKAREMGAEDCSSHCRLLPALASLSARRRNETGVDRENMLMDMLWDGGEVCSEALCSLRCTRRYLHAACPDATPQLIEMFIRPLNSLRGLVHRITDNWQTSDKSEIEQITPRQCNKLVDEKTLDDIRFGKEFLSNLRTFEDYSKHRMLDQFKDNFTVEYHQTLLEMILEPPSLWYYFYIVLILVSLVLPLVLIYWYYKIFEEIYKNDPFHKPWHYRPKKWFWRRFNVVLRAYPSLQKVFGPPREEYDKKEEDWLEEPSLCETQCCSEDGEASLPLDTTQLTTTPPSSPSSPSSPAYSIPALAPSPGESSSYVRAEQVEPPKEERVSERIPVKSWIILETKEGRVISRQDSSSALSSRLPSAPTPSSAVRRSPSIRLTMSPIHEHIEMSADRIRYKAAVAVVGESTPVAAMETPVSALSPPLPMLTPCAHMPDAEDASSTHSTPKILPATPDALDANATPTEATPTAVGEFYTPAVVFEEEEEEEKE